MTKSKSSQLTKRPPAEPKLKCPECGQLTLGRNGFDRNGWQKRRCRPCGFTSTDGGTNPPGRPPIGEARMTDYEYTKRNRAKHKTGTERSGSYWYVIEEPAALNTKEGVIALARGRRLALMEAHPGKVVRLLSGYPAGMRKWIRATFDGGDS